MFEVERAVTYYPKDTEYLREQRKTFSTLEQIMSKNGERGSKKVCQKYIKACNLLLTEITGYTNGNVNSRDWKIVQTHAPFPS